MKVLTWSRACPNSSTCDTRCELCSCEPRIQYPILGSPDTRQRVYYHSKEEGRMLHEGFDPLRDRHRHLHEVVGPYLVLLKALFSWTNYNNKERVL